MLHPQKKALTRKESEDLRRGLNGGLDSLSLDKLTKALSHKLSPDEKDLLDKVKGNLHKRDREQIVQAFNDRGFDEAQNVIIQSPFMQAIPIEIRALAASLVLLFALGLPGIAKADDDTKFTKREVIKLIKESLEEGMPPKDIVDVLKKEIKESGLHSNPDAVAKMSVDQLRDYIESQAQKEDAENFKNFKLKLDNDDYVKKAIKAFAKRLKVDDKGEYVKKDGSAVTSAFRNRVFLEALCSAEELESLKRLLGKDKLLGMVDGLLDAKGIKTRKSKSSLDYSAIANRHQIINLLQESLDDGLSPKDIVDVLRDEIKESGLHSDPDVVAKMSASELKDHIGLKIKRDNLDITKNFKLKLENKKLVTSAVESIKKTLKPGDKGGYFKKDGTPLTQGHLDERFLDAITVPLEKAFLDKILGANTMKALIRPVMNTNGLKPAAKP